MMKIRPQSGPQEAFLSSPADIIIYGGSAGGGKTTALLLECLRNIHIKGFGAIIFRRTYPQIRSVGGLWDTSEEFYPHAGGLPKESDLTWEFKPYGTNIKFAHLEHEKNKHDYQGAQIPLICYDELTHFSESMFFYLLSRNRSTCGVKPYIRATCNPDPDSWVAFFISWWIDQDTGFAIPERSGIIRYFVRINNIIRWDDSVGALWEQVKNEIPEEDYHPQSFTFIAAKLDDNPALTEKDPGYKGRLMALDMVERDRLLGGNWKIRYQAGTMFREEWFTQNIIDVSEIPCNPLDLHYIRWWDAAATAQSKDSNNPDWCSGLLMGEFKGRFYIFDVNHFRETPAGVYRKMESTRDIDGKKVTIGMEQEPGSASVREIDTLKTTMFSGYSFHSETSSGSKIIRAKLLSSACENGLVYLIRGHWNREFIQELVNFPDPKWHDDQADSASASFNYLSSRKGMNNFSLSSIATTISR